MTPEVMQPTAWRVARAQRETSDTVTLTLTPPARVAFDPGQFNMLYAFAVGEIPISMSGDPGCPHEIVHTIKNVGPVSSALSRLHADGVVGVRGPFGRPWPMTEMAGRDLILIAGGLGVAPLRPVMYHVLRDRDAYGGVTLLVGARTPRDLLYTREIADWRARPDVHVTVTVDRADAQWRGRVGVVPALIGRVPISPGRTAALVCGPEVMMRFAIRDLLRHGLTAADIYVSLERNMHCAVGWCGHCQFGPSFVCKDGPVFRFDQLQSRFSIREL